MDNLKTLLITLNTPFSLLSLRYPRYSILLVMSSVAEVL